MTTQFVLRSDKKDGTGRCPVHLVVHFDGARLKCATGEKCKPGDWNAGRQKFRALFPLAEEANQLRLPDPGPGPRAGRTARAALEELLPARPGTGLTNDQCPVPCPL